MKPAKKMWEEGVEPADFPNGLSPRWPLEYLPKPFQYSKRTEPIEGLEPRPADYKSAALAN